MIVRIFSTLRAAQTFADQVGGKWAAIDGGMGGFRVEYQDNGR